MKIPWSELEPAVKESLFGMTSVGFCLACGDEVMHVEPDACEYPCEGCGENQVFGAEEILIMEEIDYDA